MNAPFEPAKLQAVVDRFPAGNQALLVHMFQEVQAELNWLPGEAIVAVASHLDVPLTKAYSVATFYKAFSLRPRGKELVNVCMGTSCHIRGASVVVEDLRQGLGIGPGETTDDMEYTVETVNCVGACALAPVVIAGGDYIADVKPGTILSRLKKR